MFAGIAVSGWSQPTIDPPDIFGRFEIHPRSPSRPSTMNKGGLHWLTFPMRAGSYSPNDMVDALFEVVQAKIAKYSAKPGAMDEFYLLVH